MRVGQMIDVSRTPLHEIQRALVKKILVAKFDGDRVRVQKLQQLSDRLEAYRQQGKKLAVDLDKAINTEGEK